MYIIKRYANRKLYDTVTKKYVTLDGVAGLIRRGHEVVVIDNDSGEDLTATTLSQILLAQEKHGRNRLPTGLLTNLVQAGGQSLDNLRRSFLSSVGAVHIVEEQVARKLDALAQRGELTLDEADMLRAKLFDTHRPAAPPAAEDVDAQVAARVDAALQSMSLPSHADLDELQNRIEELLEKVDSLVTATEPAAKPQPKPAGRSRR